MTQTPETKKPVPSTLKLRIAAVLSGLLVMCMALVAPVAAAGPAINGTILEILTAVTGLLPSFLNLVIAVAPVIITVAIISFIVLFIKAIISMMNF
jgi:hypothetical protein